MKNEVAIKILNILETMDMRLYDIENELEALDVTSGFAVYGVDKNIRDLKLFLEKNTNVE